MSVITRALKAGGTYWAPIGHDGFKPTFAAPVPVKRRWEGDDKLRIDSEGEEFNGKAIVMVDIDVEPGGYLAEKSFGEADPLDVPDAFRIRRFMKTPTFRQTEFLREAFL